MSDKNTKGQRDSQGKFTKGNLGGPGNPFARQVGKLKKVMLECVTEADMAEIVNTLKLIAMSGDLQAMKLLFQYVLGKPTEGVNPDRLDVEEFGLMKEEAEATSRSLDVIEYGEPGMVLGMARIARGCRSAQGAQMVKQKLAEDNAGPKPTETDEKRPAETKADTSGNAVVEEPSTNGVLAEDDGAKAKEDGGVGGLLQAFRRLIGSGVPSANGVFSGAGGVGGKDGGGVMRE